MDKEKKLEVTCECGDGTEFHVDGVEQCFVIGCGCPEYAPKDEE